MKPCRYCRQPNPRPRSPFCHDRCRKAYQRLKVRQAKDARAAPHNYGTYICPYCGREGIKRQPRHRICDDPICKAKGKAEITANYQKKHYDFKAGYVVRKVKRIRCLRCNRPFTSTGKGNRLCDPCRGDGSYYEEHGVGIFDGGWQ